MSRNPKTVMKQVAVLKAELAAEKALRGKISEALGKTMDDAARLAKQVEDYQDQRRGGAR